VSLPGIFTNTANKFLLAGYMQVDDSWRAISAIGSATNFFARTSYRLTGDGTFEEVPADGEIKHGTLGEESFENRLRTYAKMYGITRQDIINDDLGALTAIPRKLGRGAKLGLNRKFWDTFIANTTFFADPSENYLKGATTNLSSVGLGLALNEVACEDGRRRRDPRLDAEDPARAAGTRAGRAGAHAVDHLQHGRRRHDRAGSQRQHLGKPLPSRRQRLPRERSGDAVVPARGSERHPDDRSAVPQRAAAPDDRTARRRFQYASACSCVVTSTSACALADARGGLKVKGAA
jgi:hypothetical protein